VLEAAERLRSREDIAFVFVGGGSEFQKVKAFAQERSLSNVLCLPYRPISELAGSLSAADVHLVVMGEPFVGIVHPCKVYNILRIGTPILYIGPKPSHVSEILERSAACVSSGNAEHGDTEAVVSAILRLAKTPPPLKSNSGSAFLKDFSRQSLLPKFIETLEAVGEKAETLKIGEGLKTKDQRPETSEKLKR
jgi:hypothetical protein